MPRLTQASFPSARWHRLPEPFGRRVVQVLDRNSRYRPSALSSCGPVIGDLISGQMPMGVVAVTGQVPNFIARTNCGFSP